MAPRLESELEPLNASVASIFDQAQNSVANHKKNCVALYKIHAKVSAPAGSKSNKASVEEGQLAFTEVFLDMLSRVLAVKKGPATADRIVKFVAQYVRYLNEKAQEDEAKRQPTIPSNSISSGSADDEDTLASVFISSILEWLIRGFLAKNKIVRYQSVHLVAEMIPYLGEIDEDSYLGLREGLIERSTCDKESSVRAQGVAALARLIGSDDPSELQQGERSILEVLLDVMCLDPAADVRRATLLHIPLTSDTLDVILARTRDIDPLTRKLVYSSVLQPKLGHPRHLTIAQREQIVQTGLGDREPAVRLAAGKMVAAWFDMVLVDGPRPEDKVAWVGDDGGIMVGLISFLTLFDVVGPGEVIAVDAVLSILSARPDLFDTFVFSDDYWKLLTPESAVLARVFLEQCLTVEREDRLESASLPVVTAFAFHIQDAYNQLLGILDDAEVAKALSGDEEVADDMEEELAKKEIILGELLRMAVKLDYMDEIGRRKVYSVTRDMLAHPQLPPGLIERCLDVLKEIMPTERELIRVVVEIVMDLREDDEPEMNEVQDNDTTQSDVTQSTIRKERSIRRAMERHEMSAADAIKADLTDMRCLALCISMLERVHGNFEDNSTLEGILADLIIPSVRRKELGIREKGLVGLGLCCLIAKSIAVKSLQLFLSQIQNAPEQLKTKVLQVVFDLMIMYDQQLWARPEDGEAILTFLADTLEAEESPVVQAVLSVGLSKLLLSGLTTSSKILKSLLLAYVSPHTNGNSELRQCLAYFFSVYCYSSIDSQSHLQSIFMAAFDEVTRMHDELGEDQTMVTPHQFGLLVLDWTDSQKSAETPLPSSHPQQVHADFAVDILLALYDSDRRSEDQEVLCTLLSHVHIEETLEPQLLVKLSILLEYIQTQCPFDDAALDKAIGRFKTRFTTSFAAELAELNYEEYLTEEIRQLYDFIGIDVPRYPDANSQNARATTPPDSPIPPKSSKNDPPVKRSRSEPPPPPTEDSEGSEEEEEAPPARVETPPSSPIPTKTLKNKLPAKRSRSNPAPSPAEDTDGSDDEDKVLPARVEAPPSSSIPTKASRKKPPAKRSRSKPVPALTEDTDGSGEEGPSARVETPPRARVSKPKPAAKRSRSKPAPPLTQDVDGSDEENEAPTAVPTTPVKKGTKRFRTPGAEPALPSPADKKRSRLKSPRKTNRNAAVIPKATRSSQQNARTAPKLASEEDDSVGSDVGPPSLRMGHNSVDSDDEFGGYSES